MRVAFAEGAVTKLRREFKLVLDSTEAARLCRQVITELRAPTSETAITSVYFDKAGWPLATRAIATPHDCVKVRTKEYFPDVLASRSPRVVLEVKRERNGMTRKRRVWMKRSDLATALSSGLRPILAVTYVRQVFQQQASWRITVDRDIRYYDISEQLALGNEAVSAQRLGPPVGTERRLVIEVKHLGNELPEWLSSLRAGRCSRFSKFAEGVKRLGGVEQLGMVGG